jgi:hypothetical protein
MFCPFSDDKEAHCTQQPTSRSRAIFGLVFSDARIVDRDSFGAQYAVDRIRAEATVGETERQRDSWCCVTATCQSELAAGGTGVVRSVCCHAFDCVSEGSRVRSAGRGLLLDDYLRVLLLS